VFVPLEIFVPDPSAGVELDELKTTPLVVTVAPPSAVMVPPVVAEVYDMADAEFVEVGGHVIDSVLNCMVLP
jgi:hypothetical protein